MPLFAKTEEEKRERAEKKKREKEEEQKRLAEYTQERDRIIAEEKEKAEKQKEREKQKELNKHSDFVKANERFCKSFTGFDKDLSGYEFQINSFLREFPEYRIVCMTSGTTSLGATVLCYFERIQKELNPDD